MHACEPYFNPCNTLVLCRARGGHWCASPSHKSLPKPPTIRSQPPAPAASCWSRGSAPPAIMVGGAWRGCGVRRCLRRPLAASMNM